MHTDNASALKNSLPAPRLSSGADRTLPPQFFRGVSALPRRFQKAGRFPAAGVAAVGEGVVVSGLGGVAVLATVVLFVLVVLGEDVEAFCFWNSTATARRYPSARARFDIATR